MNRLKSNLLFGLAGGALYTLIWTLVFYIREKQFTWVGVVGGIFFFLAAFLTSLIIDRVRKKKR